MNSGIVKPVIKLLTVGLILAAAKFIYLFFDVYNILDFVVFLFAGIAFGGKVPPNRLAVRTSAGFTSLCTFSIVCNKSWLLINCQRHRNLLCSIINSNPIGYGNWTFHSLKTGTPKEEERKSE